MWFVLIPGSISGHSACCLALPLPPTRLLVAALTNEVAPSVLIVEVSSLEIVAWFLPFVVSVFVSVREITREVWDADLVDDTTLLDEDCPRPALSLEILTFDSDVPVIPSAPEPKAPFPSFPLLDDSLEILMLDMEMAVVDSSSFPMVSSWFPFDGTNDAETPLV